MPFSSLFWCVVQIAQCIARQHVTKSDLYEDSMLRSTFLMPKFLPILLNVYMKYKYLYGADLVNAMQ